MRRVFAIFFALLLLVTNSGVAFASHYCGGKAVKTNISFGQNELSCGMPEMMTACNNTSQSSVLKSKGCCENQYLQLEVKDNFNRSLNIENVIPSEVALVLVFSYLTPISLNDSYNTEYSEYSSPFLKQDIPVLIQSFLI